MSCRVFKRVAQTGAKISQSNFSYLIEKQILISKTKIIISNGGKLDFPTSFERNSKNSESKNFRICLKYCRKAEPKKRPKYRSSLTFSTEMTDLFVTSRTEFNGIFSRFFCLHFLNFYFRFPS